MKNKRAYEMKVCPECESHLYLPEHLKKAKVELWACGFCDTEYSNDELKRIYKQL